MSKTRPPTTMISRVHQATPMIHLRVDEEHTSHNLRNQHVMEHADQTNNLHRLDFVRVQVLARCEQRYFMMKRYGRERTHGKRQKTQIYVQEVRMSQRFHTSTSLMSIMILSQDMSCNNIIPHLFARMMCMSYRPKSVKEHALPKRVVNGVSSDFSSSCYFAE